MPDADVPITAGSGTKIDTRTVGAGSDEHRQVMVIGDPVTAAQVATVDSSGRLLVTPQPSSVISTANSSTSVLAGGATFTGTSEDVSAYTNIFVSVFASHASATDGLSLQQSSNGTNWDFVDTFTIPASTGKIYCINPAAQFFRVVYTNGGTLQTAFRLQTIYKRHYARASANRPSDAYTNETDLETMQAFGMVWNGATWDRAPGTTQGQTMVEARSGTATLANVASSATNVTLRAANTARLGLILYNDSTSSCYAKYGATASSTSFTVFLGPGAYWEMPKPIYTGIVDGIWVAANGNMRVTELS